MQSFEFRIQQFQVSGLEFRTGALVLLLAIATLPAWAEWRSIGPIAVPQSGITTLPNGAELRAGAARIKITALRDSVIRIQIVPSGALPAGGARPAASSTETGKARKRGMPSSSGMVDGVFQTSGPARTAGASDFSWAVVSEARQWSARVRVNQTANAVELTTAELKVRIEKPSGRVTFLTASGEPISQEPLAPMYNGAAFQVTKSMPEDEHYFGLGDKAHGLDHRNQSFTMWNTDAFGWQESTDPLYKSIPFFLAMRRGRAYGIYLDNTWRSHFDFGKAVHDAYSFGAEGGPLDYYFFYGPHPKKVLENFTALIGRTPLPPLWSLGFQQCRYSYYPEARVREIARNFRERRIPADVIYLDIDYQDRNRPFTINRQYFPNFEGMIRDLGQQGFKVIAITDLHIAKAPNQNYKPFDQGVAGDHFLKNKDGSIYVGDVWPGDSVFPEFTLASGRAFWGSLYTDFVRMGIAGFWNDMNEPAIFERADKTMPLDVQHRLDPDAAAAYAPYVTAMSASRSGSSAHGGTSAGTPGLQPRVSEANSATNAAPHAAIHNVYGMQNVRATYEGLLKLRPNVRPFVLTRAGFAGAQRYAATWTGDNTSTYNHMRLSVPNLLSLGISGYPLVGDDIGGYDRSPTPELLTRWLELGVFNPVYRDHTAKGSLDQEPWVHGPEHEAIRRRYIELRYQLLPYIYTAMEETTRTGIPMMRPMFLEYPEVGPLTLNENEFLFGRDLLVAPKLWDTVDPYEVELPPGEWFDYWTGQRHKGGEKLKVQPALDAVPLYVRGGAILPQQPIVQNTTEVPNGPLTLRVYPAERDCGGSLYTDDGSTFDYTRGEFLRMSFTCTATGNAVSVNLARKEGKFQPWWKQVEVRVFGAERAPREVLVNGQRTADFKHDPATRSVSVQVPAGTADVRVTY